MFIFWQGGEMDKLLKLAIILGILIIAFSIFWRLVIIPEREAKQKVIIPSLHKIGNINDSK